MEEPKRMESLAEILRRLSFTHPTGTQTDESLWGVEESCRHCHDKQFFINPDRRPDGSINLVPCPKCNTSVRDDRDWFASLHPAHEARGNQDALDAAETMAKEPKGWLVIHGPIGSGKTTLAGAIESSVWGRQRFPPTVATLLGAWQAMVMEDDFEARFRREINSDLMVMDNLGRERLTAWKLDRLTECLDWRYARHLPTVITTEYDVNQLARRLGDRAGDGDAIADRVFSTGNGLVVVVTLKGKSFRTGKAW